MPPIEGDMSFDSAMTALENVSTKAPIAEDPNDREGSIIDDDDDDAGERVEKKKKKQPATNDVDDDADMDDDQDDGEEESSDSDADGDEDSEEGATDDADEEGDEAEQTKASAIEPPVHLDATEKEAFKKLPKEAQEILARQSKLVSADLTRKTQEIAERRKALEARVAKLREVKTERDKRMEKWAKVDWAAEARKLTPQEYNRNKAIYEKELGEYQAIQSQIETEEAADFEDHRKEQFEAIKTLAPELIDGEKGVAARKEIMEAVVKAGFDPKRLKWMTAQEMVFVRDALAWRKYQAEKKNKPAITAKKDEKAKGRTTIRSSSRANPPAGVQQSVQKQFRKAPTADNAKAALAALDVD